MSTIKQTVWWFRDQKLTKHGETTFDSWGREPEAQKPHAALWM